MSESKQKTVIGAPDGSLTFSTFYVAPFKNQKTSKATGCRKSIKFRTF